MQAIKLLILIIISGAVAATCAVLPVRVCFTDAESYAFYCGDTSANCREVHAENNFSLTKALLADVNGECAFYSADNFNMTDFLAQYGAEVIFTEELSDSVNYYCAADLPYSVQLYKAEINLHICVKQSRVLAASPIIFGGY